MSGINTPTTSLLPRKLTSTEVRLISWFKWERKNNLHIQEDQTLLLGEVLGVKSMAGYQNISTKEDKRSGMLREVVTWLSRAQNIHTKLAQPFNIFRWKIYQRLAYKGTRWITLGWTALDGAHKWEALEIPHIGGAVYQGRRIITCWTTGVGRQYRGYRLPYLPKSPGKVARFGRWTGPGRIHAWGRQ